MNKKKQSKPSPETSIVRSSAAEYLTFVAAGGNSEASVEMRYEDENIWLTQKMMSELYEPYDLGWKARTHAELALMADLHPLLTKRAGGRDISGLSAYE